MSSRQYLRASRALLLPLVLGASCAKDEGPASAPAPAPAPSRTQTLISDELHNAGTTGFLFLPPMVPRPAQIGDIVPDLPVTVRIDEITTGGQVVRTVAAFTGASGPKQERVRYHLTDAPPDVDDTDGDADPTGFYLARWHTDDSNLSLDATYRVRVFVPDRGGKLRELGYSDVDLVRNQRQFRAVDQQNYTPLINGKTLRIKFRIDRPAVDGDGDGALDWVDNCPTVANADQADAVGNGIGDACRCAALPADFGGVTCKASVATVDGARKELTHDFGGGATSSAHLELSCAPSAAPKAGAAAAPTTIHSGVLHVACGDTTFILDPALGLGVQKSTAVGAAAGKTLRFDQAVSRKAEDCAGGTCTRTTVALDVALGDLRAAGLESCRLGWSATATSGAVKIENGRILDRGATYPGIQVGSLPLWFGKDATAPILETLDGKALSGEASRVRTVCGRTADHGAAERALPTLCQAYSDGSDLISRYAFADLHTSVETARLTDRAAFGQLGQLAGGWCPGAGDVRNLEEAYRLPLKAGQKEATLTLKLLGTEAQRAAIGPGVSLKIAAQAPGGEPVALRTLNVDEWPDTGALVVALPTEIAGVAGGTIILQGTFDNKKKDPPPPPPPEPGPMDKIELALDVDVK